MSNIDELDKVGLSGQGIDVPCEFLTGSAGTGKTYEIRRRIAADHDYGQMTATTGIAAINLGTITLNSALGYFDTESLEEAFSRGLLERKLRAIAEEGYRSLIIDEVSMLDRRQLDLIYEGMRRVNEQLSWKGKPAMALVLTGDFCQLPPIKAKWAFEADCWPLFAANTVKLEKCWRQADQKFLDALNLIRHGDGEGARQLKGMVEFVEKANTSFDGTTIIAKNDMVDRFNFVAHSKVMGRLHMVSNSRWGALRGEWSQIPPQLGLKIGALVMILSNETETFEYVNGDCGHVTGFEGERFTVKLLRTGREVEIGRVIRKNQRKDPPDVYGVDSRELRDKHAWEEDDPASRPRVAYYCRSSKKWVIGEVDYYPLRLAYASTVHKSQGLTLDNVQIDCHNHFFGAPAMAYVALSRARSPQGLKIIGTPDLLASRVKIHPEVIQFL